MLYWNQQNQNSTSRRSIQLITLSKREVRQSPRKWERRTQASTKAAGTRSTPPPTPPPPKHGLTTQHPSHCEPWATYRPHSSSSHSHCLSLPAHGVSVRRSPAGHAVQWMAGDSVVQRLVGTLLLGVCVKINDQFSHCFLHVTWTGERARVKGRRAQARISDHYNHSEPLINLNLTNNNQKQKTILLHR